MQTGSESFQRLLRHPLKFRLFLLANLPSAYFCGVRIKEADGKKAVTTIRYKWFSRNPFRSVYFACLSMAAEMSTGVLAMSHLYKRKPSVSMLLVKQEGTYFKKATGKTTFVCEDGELIRQAIETSISSGEATTVRAKSAGVNEAGESVAEFFMTWSFRARTTKS